MGSSRCSSPRSRAIVAESARSPTISATGSPGTTFSSKKATTRTPNSVGIVASSRLPRSCNTHLGPALAVEDHRDVPAFYGRMLRPQIHREPEIDPGRGLIDPVVDSGVQRFAGGLIDRPAGHHDQRIGDAITVEGIVATWAEARAMEQRIEEVVGVRVVGPPVENRHVGVALADRLAHAGRVARHDLHANTNGGELRLNRLRDPAQLYIGSRAPQLHRKAVRVAGGPQQPAGFGRVVA